MISLNIVNITKYINLNIKTSFIYIISWNHRQVWSVVRQLNIIQMSIFNFLT